MTPKNDTYPQANDPLTVIGPFAFAAAEMRRNGLAILPVGGDDGKKPLVTGFQAWRGPPGLHTLHLWCHKFPGANIGVSCGPSRILVVDGDEIGLLDRVIGSFGDTPLIISTPRGGFHCYYRDSIGLASMNLRSAGLEFDIKARGGFVVAPPSLNPLRGRSYAFLRDSWDDVGKLPEVEPSAIARLTGRSIPQSWAGPERPVDLVKEGERNRYLFTYLRSLAPYTSEKEVVAAAIDYNRTQNEVPEEEVRVVATARSVWGYQKRGELQKPSRGHVRIDYAEMDALGASAGKDYPMSLALLAELRRTHGTSGTAFAVASEAMVAAQVIPGVRDPRRIDRAKRSLINAGLLRLIAKARRVKSLLRRPALYLLERAKITEPNVEKGSAELRGRGTTKPMRLTAKSAVNVSPTLAVQNAVNLIDSPPGRPDPLPGPMTQRISTAGSAIDSPATVVSRVVQ